MDPKLRSMIVEQVLRKLREQGVTAGDRKASASEEAERLIKGQYVQPAPGKEARPVPYPETSASLHMPERKKEQKPEDLAAAEARSRIGIAHPQDREALVRMKQATTARIGVGRTGPRLLTDTMLTLRADHAQARDAVFADVSKNMLDTLGLFSVQSLCEDKNTFLTRPDLGRKLSDDSVEKLRSRCVMQPDVQIFAADGLSSTAIEVNLANILPVLTEALTAKGIKVGTPFFVRFGRVAVEDHVSEILGCKVVCVLIGERPGLATAESMSAYTVYNAYVGMPESRRTVVSNIHKDGIAAVEAGAYLADVIEQILENKASGVELTK
ncbi:MAG: ethanolamine ammonia-lyase subunit EutC [Eubacterium sp.]|nr:ethanolamine ammonia-lyase subunit EutC [Eubacterium sp.]